MALALETCWTPLDVRHLVEFLVHPFGPFSAKAHGLLAKALADQPGIGSDRWIAAKASIQKLDN
jgi:hypothetical protein